MKSKEEEEDGGEEEEGQKGKSFIEKLRRRAVSVGHRRVIRPPSTPTRISFNPNNPSSSKFASSSRKLAASLWEFYQYYDQDREIPPVAKMHRPPYSSGGDPSNRRLRHDHGKTAIRDNGLDLTDDQPESAGSIRKQIGQMLMKHHQRNQPLSPASSLEVAPYNGGAITPGSSLDLHGRRRAGEPNHNNNLKTSTELLKVLNRIWTLEEQHSANISLIKSLKSELAHSRARIKELLRCQQADRREMDELVKQLAEEKLSNEDNTKERDRLSSAVQQLEEERRLRRRSESLYKKLARELSEAKSALSSCVEEMERGSKWRKMMERLCDEFARGIKRYEREVHGLKQKVDKSCWGEEDQMVLCIAETWLDERIQSGGEEGSVVEKLEVEIEAFLKSKEKLPKNQRRSSLESAPFNAMSAPIQEVESEEEEEEEEDSNCFELKKHGSDVAKPPSSLQVKFEDQMAWAMSNNEKKKKSEGDKSEKERNNNVVGEMIRSHRRLVSETQGMDEGSCSYLPPPSSSRRAESPIRHWNPRAMTSDLTATGQGVKKDNTLKAKLSEARTKSSRPRIRLFKG